MTPIDDLKAYFDDAGLTGVAITGTDTAVCGEYWYGASYRDTGGILPGVYNGKPCYFGVTGSALYWDDGTSKWVIAAELGGTALYTRTSATMAGAYTAVTGTATVTVAAQSIWPRARYLNDAQTVLSTAIANRDADANRWTSYQVQCSLYVPYTDPNDRMRAELVAEQRGLALVYYFTALQGTRAGVPGLTLDDWRAQQVRCDYVGVVDNLPLAKGGLLKAVSTLTLVNLAANSAA